MKKHLLALTLFLIVSAQAFAQVAPSFDIFILPYRFGDKSMTYFEGNGFDTQNARIMTQGNIVYSSTNSKYDPAKVKDFILRFYPDVNTTENLVLDWEAGPYADLRDYPVTDSRFKTAEATLLNLLSEIRKYRPHLKLSYYMLPYRTWNEWQAANYNAPGKLDNIMASVDFIAPSLYFLFADEEVGRTRNMQYMKDNLDMAMKYGQKYGKPVYPFLWHRVHFRSPLYGKAIVQEGVYTDYVKYMKDYSYNGAKLKGMYWWDGIEGKLENLAGVNNWLNGSVYDEATYDQMIVNMAKSMKAALNSGTAAPAPLPQPLPVPIVIAQQVVELALYDAVTGQQLQTLASGATLNLATLPTKSFNIRATTNTTVGSVQFVMSGTGSKTATETLAPYDLMGDTGSWTPAVGNYTLKATPYTGAKATGDAGTALSVSFTVINQTPPAVVSYTLFDAATRQELQTLANGVTLNLATLPSKSFNIRANTSAPAGNVVFALSGAESKNVTDAAAPFELLGDAGSWTPAVGSYTLQATAALAATGETGATLAIGFNVINQAPLAVTSYTLYDATTGQQLQTLASGATLNLATLPTKSFNIRANTNNTAGKVLFTLTGAENKNVTDATAPYYLAGEAGSWTPTVGNYTLQSTGYLDATDEAGKTFVVDFTVINQTPPAVVSYTLFDAATRQELQTLANGVTLNLATLPSKSFNIRANTSAPAGNVVFALSGAESKNVTDAAAPFELLGDAGSWTPAVGSYTLQATAALAATGETGATLAIGFNVINQAPLAVTSYTLYDATTGQQLQTLASGATLNLATLQTKSFNIRATTNTTVGSVQFVMSGTESKTATETLAPYDLMGDVGSWTPAVGNYTLKATPYTGAKATGDAGTAFSVSFAVVNIPQGPTLVLVNADTDKDIQILTNGDVLNLATLPTKNLNIRYNNITAVGSVVFSLSGAKSQNTIESGAPYALFGDNSGDYNAWVPAVGSYMLKATPYSALKGTGTAGTSQTVSFSVVNSTTGIALTSKASTETGPTTGLTVYPIPAKTELHVDLNSAAEAGMATIELLDVNGRVILSKSVNTATDGHTTKLDLQSASQGVYILSVNSAAGRTTKRVVINR
ncbi:T9SS type A sorting domain-containing protein [Pontibacter liquoris]|uniref:T9SS type A sorting domain-containing protein n=1 Tax=Pontibacter liquoris TaxID=2905677 RepID=UPI001FA6DCD2|nr:T9SS type A sorting domain-containing protein [Pontibacter liquoris]